MWIGTPHVEKWTLKGFAAILGSIRFSISITVANWAMTQKSSKVPTKQEFEQLPLDVLATWCKRIADKPRYYGEVASSEAEELRRQWFHLQGTPSTSSGVAEQEELERQAELKKRMAGFLAGILLG